MTTPSLDDDDLTIVRWYECERRPRRPTIRRWPCRWDCGHSHDGPRPRPRSSEQRVEAARRHLAYLRHLDEQPPTLLEVYLQARDMRADLHVACGRYRIHLAGVTLREGSLDTGPILSGV